MKSQIDSDMTLEELMDKIDLNATIRNQVRKYSGQSNYYRLKPLFPKPEFFAAVSEMEDPPFIYLLFYLKLALESFPLYLENFSEEIYFQNFRDLAIWSNSYLESTGKVGLLKAEWLTKPFSFQIFRLGRLQFEPMNLSKNSFGLEIGTPVLAVHIPADGPLIIEECRKSFAAAKLFFKEERPFICDSWLLAPALKKLLSANSNIIRFQELFEVMEINQMNSQGEERIFGELLLDPADYPEDTQLRAAAKQHLLAGGRIGTALGIYKEA